MTSKFDIPCSLLAIGLTLSPSIIPHLLRNRTFLVPCSLLGCHFLLLSFLIYFEIGHSLFLVRYWDVTFSFYHSSFTSKSDIPCSLFAIGLSLSPSIIPPLPRNLTFLVPCSLLGYHLLLPSFLIYLVIRHFIPRW